MNQRIRLSSKIDAGVKAAITQAIDKHRKLGQSISIWRDGKVVTLTAEQISTIHIKNPVTTNS